MFISVSVGRRLAALAAAAGVCAISGAASAGVVAVPAFVSADENGNGSFVVPSMGLSAPMPGVMTADTSFGGLPSALFYAMGDAPFVVLGDLLISEFAGGPVSDVIRFTSANFQQGFFFYSDIDGLPDAIADVGLPTSPVPNNNVFGVETTLPDGSIGFTYHPQPGQPGYTGFDTTYTFISEIVPAPGAAAMVGLGGLLAGGGRRRRW